jgi:DNA-binding NtrC family response regulator
VTNVNLAEAVKRKNFREDLFYRLNVVHIDVPPLRARTKDLPALVNAFLKSSAGKHGKDVSRISNEALGLLGEYEFPGNVRELANTIERAVIVAEGGRIEAFDLPQSLQAAVQVQRRKEKPLSLAEIEAEYVEETLKTTKGNKTEAARILGISRKNLYERLARMNKVEN